MCRDIIFSLQKPLSTPRGNGAGCAMQSKKMTGCEAQMWRLQGSLIEASPPTLTPQHQLCITDN
ncbi:rCG45343 [Rattus norvegicus]|uniref:RCG45343 n=1 Tax=Rattus norvegicus TaxID=10116 RepID=A6K9B5_RAT|nr:rCG45343 [Rattus norvegicus]